MLPAEGRCGAGERLDVLCDDGISGSKAEDERLALAELLTAVRDGEISTVIVCKKDRLARDQALPVTSRRSSVAPELH
jgi:DNA invertase Pin-like site-specific DNA recombinase